MNIFSAHSNNFYGTLPTSFANCKQLQVLDLSKNGLTGELPQYFTSFRGLRILSIGYNNLHGSIPQHITDLTNLCLLDLSNNKFSGRIPTHLERLSGYVDVTNNYAVSGELEIVVKKYVYKLPYLWPAYTIFDLSCNNFIGEIPASIGSMSGLRLLNLSQNQLEGRIPATISGISTLEQLDLANNNLSGPIPQELSKLHQLSTLDVSSNNLCGRIPTGTQFSTFNVTSFQNNMCLRGCPLDSCNENEPPLGKDGGASNNTNVKVDWLSHVKKNMSLIALEIGMGIGFGGVIIVFLSWKRARDWMIPPNMPPEPVWGEYTFPT
jgi:Leucine-rich repeat (LRR) protein